MAKYIFVTGGVVSGLGKGITAASLGRLLIERGLNVTIQKLDPYLNVDPGTMSPMEHGEVFVTEDGAETDLDIGHYERFLGRSLTRGSTRTGGQIYLNVINKERRGEYLGKNVQIVPHITNEIIDTMKSVGEGQDIVIVEVGGTVGDIESMTFIEAISQFRKQLGHGNSLSIHVTLLPHLPMSGEVKTKPTQASVRELSSMGVRPDIIVLRSGADIELDEEGRKKIVMFCNLDSINDVIHNKDCRSIYEVPLVLKDQKLDDNVLAKLGMTASQSEMKEWRKLVKHLLNGYETKKIALVGKYTTMPDAYISVMESIKLAGVEVGVKPQITLVDCGEIEKKGAKQVLAGFDAIVLAGGFGTRGVLGMIHTVQYVRENDIPFLGICLGMQVSVIEYARNVIGMEGADSTEFRPDTKYPVVHIMENQKEVTGKGGSMRLGLYDCHIKSGTLASKLYKAKTIQERHRHRYEFNNEFRGKLEGLVISGENNGLVEIVENPKNKFFIACQFHPEFLSKPGSPHPLFVGLMKASR